MSLFECLAINAIEFAKRRHYSHLGHIFIPEFLGFRTWTASDEFQNIKMKK